MGSAAVLSTDLEATPVHRRLKIVTRSLAALAAVAISASLATPAQAIANGTPVETGKYGFSVKLTMTDIPRVDGTKYNSACSGALIARQWIITAGHCFHRFRVRVSGPTPYPTTATIARTDLADTTGHVVDVVEVFQSSSNDVALGRLATPVRDVQPLRVGRKAAKVGEVVRLTGWGATDPNNITPATRLHTGTFTVTSLATTTLGVTGLAPEPDTSACPYDSGAPYFRERAYGRAVLVGVENGGPDCPHALEETASRVDVLAEWIRSTVRGGTGEQLSLED